MCIVTEQGSQWRQFPAALAKVAVVAATVAFAGAAAAAAAVQAGVELERYFFRSLAAMCIVTELWALASSSLRHHRIPAAIAAAAVATAVAAFVAAAASVVAKEYGVSEGVAAVALLPAVWIVASLTASANAMPPSKAKSEEQTHQHRTRGVSLGAPPKSAKVGETTQQQCQEPARQTQLECSDTPRITTA